MARQTKQRPVGAVEANRLIDEFTRLMRNYGIVNAERAISAAFNEALRSITKTQPANRKVGRPTDSPDRAKTAWFMIEVAIARDQSQSFRSVAADISKYPFFGKKVSAATLRALHAKYEVVLKDDSERARMERAVIAEAAR